MVKVLALIMSPWVLFGGLLGAGETIVVAALAGVTAGVILGIAIILWFFFYS